MRYQRYQTYKDSGVAWLGQVPAHWEVKRLKHIFHIVKRIAHSDEYDVLSVTQKGIKIKDIDSNEGQLAENYSHYQIVNIGDFVMNHMDLITGYVDISKYLGVTSPDYRVFQSHDESNNNEYLLRLLQMCYHQKLFFPFGQGSSQLGRWRLPTDGFLNFLFPLPPLAEQQAIAAFLDRECAQIDTLVAAQQRLIALLKEKRQALIAHTVTQGLDPAAPRKDSGVAWLGQVPAHWEVVQLKRVLSIQNGSDYKHIQVDEGYPVIGSGGIFAYASNYMFDGETILLGRKGTIDRPIHFSGKFWAVDTMFWSQIDAHASGRFIYYIATQIPFGMYSTNTALPSMAKSDLESHLCPLPPLAEQQAIAAFLDRECAQIDTLVAKAEQAITLLHERRSALIAAAVTGQIRVDGEELRMNN